MSKKFNPEIYQKLKENKLLIYCIYSVLEDKNDCNFERLVKECYTLFPEVFGMKKYPQWPNSCKLDRPIRDLRLDGLITGSVRSRFSLTMYGERVAKETESILMGKVPNLNLKPQIRMNGLLKHIQESVPFKKFLNNQNNFEINEMELRDVLYCTLETPARIIRQNLAFALNLAKESKLDSMTDFLNLCKKSLKKKNANTQKTTN